MNRAKGVQKHTIVSDRSCIQPQDVVTAAIEACNGGNS